MWIISFIHRNCQLLFIWFPTSLINRCKFPIIHMYAWCQPVFRLLLAVASRFTIPIITAEVISLKKSRRSRPSVKAVIWFFIPAGVSVYILPPIKLPIWYRKKQCLCWFESTHLSSVCLYLIYFHSPLFLLSLSRQSLWCMAGRFSVSPQACRFIPLRLEQRLFVFMKRSFSLLLQGAGRVDWVQVRVQNPSHLQSGLFALNQSGKCRLFCTSVVVFGSVYQI